MTVETCSLRPGYSISRVIKGGWQLAGGHGAFDRADAVRDMAKFLDAGINTFDCADIYTGVEEMIGEFIANVRSDRGSEAAEVVRLHTKLVPDFDRLESFTPTEVEAIIDRSLKRLQLEQLHLVQFFWWDMARGRPVEVLSSLKTLQEKGKILHLGSTNWDTGNIISFLDAGVDVVSMQVQYSLLDARPEGRFVNWCAGHDIGILCYGTLAGGFLSDAWLGRSDPGFEFENRSLIKYRLIIDEFGGWELFQELLCALEQIAKKYGVTLSAIASRAILDKPQVAGVIIGARTARHLEKILPIFDLQLDNADRAALDNVLSRRTGPDGPVYGLEGDRTGPHGRIMKYNLNVVQA